MQHVSPISQCSRREIRPAAALVTAAWLGALGTLLVNDHLLKGSGVLPGFVTGKLSDFAGLLVAPVLLAALLSVRTRAGLIAAHLAVGIVFSGIQLSRPFADLWSELMGLVGFPWTITSDPSDLVALPMLALSYALFLPAMQGRPAATELRFLRTAAGGVGVLACAATSPAVGPGPLVYPPIETDLYLHNQSDVEREILVRALSPGVVLDCDAVSEDPGAMLPDAAFGEATSWVVPPWANIPVLLDAWELDESECRAAVVSGPGIQQRILFWWTDEVPVRTVQGQFFEGDFTLPSGGVRVDPDGQSHSIGGRFVFVPTSLAPVAEACELPDQGDRIDWALPPDWSFSFGFEMTVEAIDAGIDGCLAVDGTVTGPEVLYLCMPPDLFPFAVGDLLAITPQESYLQIERVSVDDPTLALLLVRAHPAGGEPQVTPRAGACGYTSAEGCVHVGRPAAADVVWGIANETLEPGDRLHVPLEDGGLGRIELVFAEELAVLDDACESEAGYLDDDWQFVIDYAAVIHGAG